MGDIFQRIKRIVLSIISLGLYKYEDPSVIGPYLIDSMRKKLGDLKSSAVPVIANQYRIERMLEAERKKCAELDSDARAAVTQKEDDLASNLLLQKESSQSRITDLETQLTAAQQSAEDAKQQIEMFQDELKTAEDRARSAQMRYQLATMRQQVQKFGTGLSLDDDMKALDRMEEKADQAFASSQAMGDIASMSDDAKRHQVRQAARKMHADQALADLKAEMGLSDTEKRFKKLSDEIGGEEKTTEPQTAENAEQVQQKIAGSDSANESAG